MSPDEIHALFARHVSPGKVRTFERYGMRLIMGARGGARFRDAVSGVELYNCHSNGGVFNLGHRHPRVIEAVIEALARVDIGNHHLVSEARARLGARLSRTSGDRLSGVVFGVSGGEAIDLALKVARGSTRRRGIVSASGGYHGHTGLAMAAGDPQYRDPFLGDQPEFTQVPFDDLPAMERAIGDATAAVILEPIPATLGMPIPRPGYLAGVARLCRERGALFIADEVQTGLGRTGRMWAHEHDEVEPDLLVTGKGLSGGVYPITATLMTPALHRLFDEHPFAHVSTFGGAEPGCAAATAVLDLVEAPGFLERVAALGERFAAGFAGAPFELRRRGLMMGLLFPVEDAGLMAAKMLYEAGVFAVYANNDSRVCQFLPPLILEDAEVDDIIRRVRGCFG